MKVTDHLQSRITWNKEAAQHWFRALSQRCTCERTWGCKSDYVRGISVQENADLKMAANDKFERQADAGGDAGNTIGPGAPPVAFAVALVFLLIELGLTFTWRGRSNFGSDVLGSTGDEADGGGSGLGGGEPLGLSAPGAGGGGFRGPRSGSGGFLGPCHGLLRRLCCFLPRARGRCGLDGRTCVQSSDLSHQLVIISLAIGH